MLTGQDNPQVLAGLLVIFWRRNTQVLVLPPKIGSSGSLPVAFKKVGEK